MEPISFSCVTMSRGSHILCRTASSYEGGRSEDLISFPRTADGQLTLEYDTNTSMSLNSTPLSSPV